MPRLLLVDDNPSIHKISETLLASSDVQLVSCGSGAQAMALVDQGDHFDVALLDTSMMGMDGWTLLQRLRETEATSRMPVAMMAGVLDVVDPEKVRRAPIQGFLKKPIELRDLADRVKRLMETPVAPPAPEPVPAAGPAAPPPPVESAPAPAPPPFLTRPSMRIPEEFRAPVPEDDLLLLGPEDVLQEALDAGEPAPVEGRAPEPPLALEAFDVQEIPITLAAPAEPAQPAAAAEEPLDLEELDLESLRNLNLPTAPAPAEEALAPEAPAPEVPAAEAAPEPAPAATGAGPFEVPEFLLTDTLPDLPETGVLESTVTGEDLPDLAPAPAAPPTPAAPEPILVLPSAGEPIDWTDDSDTLVAAAPPPPPAPEPEPTPLAVTPLAAFSDGITLSDLLDAGPPPLTAATPAAAPAPGPTPTPQAGAWPLETGAWATPAPVAVQEAPGPDPLALLLADPALLDRLAKAVVARLGDQALREIAWEVMPELAERLARKDAP
jgi:CheY-like chemotaxis protein